MKKWLALIGCFALATINLLALGEPTTFTLQPAESRAQAGEIFRVDLHLATDVDLFKATVRVASNNPKVTIKEIEFPAYAANVTLNDYSISADNTEFLVGPETMFALLFQAGFKGVIATVVFEVAENAIAGVDTAELTLSVEKHGGANIGCFDMQYSEKVASALNGGSMTVVKLFNAPALAGNAIEDVTEPVAVTPVFTDENGAVIDGTISLVTFDYPVGDDASTLGAFAVSGDGKSILYTAPTVVGNVAPFDVVAFYEASNGVNEDGNTVTITVTPVNDLHVVTIDGPVSANEDALLEFTVSIEDEENGEFDLVVFRQDGNDLIEIPGTWVGLAFTSADVLGFGEVIHPETTKSVNLKVEAIDRYDGLSADSAPAELNINDVDQHVGAATDLAIQPPAAYTTSALNVDFTDAVDPDPEDVVTYAYAWTNNQNNEVVITATVPAGIAKKDEVWTVVVTARSFNGDQQASEPASITILNSAPTVVDGTLFIQKGDALPKFKDIDLAAFASDADGAGDVVAFNITADPTKGTLELVEGTVYRYTVTGDDEFFGGDADTFNFAAVDADEAVSGEGTITVTYRTNPPPVFVAGTATGIEAAGYDEAEGLALTASVEVGDTDSAGGTVPGTGVAQVIWKLTVNGEDKDWLDYNASPGIAEEDTGVISCTVNFPGFDTVFGAARPAELTFLLSVVATDGNEGGGADSEPFVFPAIVIRDIDRAPTAPTSIDLQKVAGGGRGALVLHTGDTVTALAADAIDPDGDALLGYEYDWQLTNSKLAEVDPITSEIVDKDVACAWPFGRALIKGDVLAVAARAASAPLYDLAAILSSSTYGEAAVTVANTAPYFVTEAGVTWEVFESDSGINTETEKLGFAWEMGIGITRSAGAVGTALLVANDIDAAASDAQADSLAFSINQDSYDQAETGLVAIGTDGKSITYQPARFYNGDFTVEVVVTDEDGESAIYVLNIKVSPVNDKPVIAVNDVYALPSDCDGVTLQVKYFAVYPGGDDVSENDQLLTDAFVAMEDILGIIVAGTMEVDVVNELDLNDEDQAKLAATGASRAIVVKYVLSTNAPMGEELNVTLQVNDDGGTREGMNDNVGITSFKIVLGATPWYPIYQLPCEDHATHQVTLTAPGQPRVVVYVSGNMLKPEHYYYSSSDGLASGVEYQVELRPWNPIQGVAGAPCAANPADLLLQVPEYGLPGQAEVAITGPDAETGKYTFAIKAPLAGSYVLTITRNGMAFKTITSNFVPNAEGLILPNLNLEMNLFADGDYEATVHGVNPMGAGEESEPATVSVGTGAIAQLAWPADGQFVPDSGKNIVVAAGVTSTKVKFTWPVVSAATGYNFFLYDSQGKEVKTSRNIQVNTLDVTVAITASSFGSYTWWVEAINGNASLTSSTLSFRLVEKTDAPLLEGFVIAGINKLELHFSAEQGALPAVGSVMYEVQHYDASIQQWIMYLIKDGNGVRPVDNGLGVWTITLPGTELAVGDYLLVREYVGGKVQGNFVLYRINQ